MDQAEVPFGQVFGGHGQLARGEEPSLAFLHGNAQRAEPVACVTRRVAFGEPLLVGVRLGRHRDDVEVDAVGLMERRATSGGCRQVAPPAAAIVRHAARAGLAGSADSRAHSHALTSPASVLVPTIRVERMTFRLQGGCSTN